MEFIIVDEHSNESHYDLLTNLNDVSMGECYLYVGKGVNDTSTGFLYTNTESMVGGLVYAFTGIAGFILNFLVIIALMKTPSLRNEYLTPFIISLALTDVLFSALALPLRAVSYFAR